MIKIYPLFSGSSGNCTYAEFENGKGILIDAGRSARQIEISLKKKNIDPLNIKAIFVTHEHTDHVSGLRVFSGKYNIKVYGSEGTVNCLKSKGILSDKSNYKIIKKEDTDYGFVSVKPFSISHDCEEGFGYTITNKIGEKFSMCTDLGYVSDEVKKSIIGSKIIMLESNHDVMMVQNGPYPYYLKRRILSDHGHLSNESCAEILPWLVNSGTKSIILSHLSQHNNIPELAVQTSLCLLSKHSMTPGKDFNLSPAPKTNDINLSFSV